MDSESQGLPACAKCGAALRADARFCARCGTRSAPAEEEPQAAAESAPPSADQWVPEILPRALRWDDLRVVGWLYGTLLLTSLLGGLGYSIYPKGNFGLWTMVIDAFVIIGFAGYHRKEIFPLLHPSTFDGQALLKLVIATVVQFVGLGAAFYLLEKAGVPFERITDEIERYDYNLWQLIVIFSLAPAVFEEIAFRGVIFDRLRRVLGEQEAWLVQAAFFSVLHLSPAIFITHFAMGLILGWLRMRTNSLLPSMVLHATWNASVIFLELYG